MMHTSQPDITSLAEAFRHDYCLAVIELIHNNESRHHCFSLQDAYQVSKKVAPGVFANFSEMGCNFNMKFYRFT